MSVIGFVRDFRTSSVRRKFSLNVRRLQEAVDLYFNGTDKEKFINALNEYQANRSIHAFVSTIGTLFDTPVKQDLLPLIRKIIPPVDQAQFDQYVQQLLQQTVTDESRAINRIRFGSARLLPSKPRSSILSGSLFRKKPKQNTLDPILHYPRTSTPVQHSISVDQLVVPQVSSATGPIQPAVSEPYLNVETAVHQQNGHSPAASSQISLTKNVKVAKLTFIPTGDERDDVLAQLGLCLNSLNGRTVISHVIPGSWAEKHHLSSGDRLVAINQILLNGLASDDVVKMLRAAKKIDLYCVRKNSHLPPGASDGSLAASSSSLLASVTPSARSSMRSNTTIISEMSVDESIAWVDADGRPCSPPLSLSNEGQDRASTSKERRMEKLTLTTGFDRHRLGLMLRGGSEFGLGLYVTSVSRGSIASKSGLRVGHRILEVNGISLSDMPHLEAVKLLKQTANPVLSVVYVGKVPFSATRRKKLTNSGPDFTSFSSSDTSVSPSQQARISSNVAALKPSEETRVATSSGSSSGREHADAFRRVLNEKDTRALLFYISEYHGGRMNVDSFASVIYHLLNSPSKQSVLDEIRSLISMGDRSTFERILSERSTPTADQRVSVFEAPKVSQSRRTSTSDSDVIDPPLGFGNSQSSPTTPAVFAPGVALTELDIAQNGPVIAGVATIGHIVGPVPLSSIEEGSEHTSPELKSRSHTRNLYDRSSESMDSKQEPALKVQRDLEKAVEVEEQSQSLSPAHNVANEDTEHFFYNSLRDSYRRVKSVSSPSTSIHSRRSQVLTKSLGESELNVFSPVADVLEVQEKEIDVNEELLEDNQNIAYQSRASNMAGFAADEVVYGDDVDDAPERFKSLKESPVFHRKVASIENLAIWNSSDKVRSTSPLSRRKPAPSPRMERVSPYLGTKAQLANGFRSADYILDFANDSAYLVSGSQSKMQANVPSSSNAVDGVAQSPTRLSNAFLSEMNSVILSKMQAIGINMASAENGTSDFESKVSSRVRGNKEIGRQLEENDMASTGIVDCSVSVASGSNSSFKTVGNFEQNLVIRPNEDLQPSLEKVSSKIKSKRTTAPSTNPRSRIRKLVVYKTKPNLGISVEGGADTRQTLPKIIDIAPTGSAADSQLQVRDVLLEVDGQSLIGMNHKSAARTIAQSFKNKSRNWMNFTVQTEVASPR